MYVRKNGASIAPCIISRVKVALDVPNQYKGNNKSCSDDYWNDVVYIVGTKHNVSTERINQALR
ncbi:MAG TPA: hypothetical protein VL098_12605 [Flavipsychrobacter sp.]|nr:hypothetical protein [Flavipsychrobacter sp.]